ncbi:MAG: hypothetical protein ACE5MG_13900 [Candidatus Methylomirabilales bacterium]
MAKRVVTLLIVASLIAGTAGLATASEHDFATRGFRDNPGRWVGYIIFPVGWLLDTVVARPIGLVACLAPNLTGCTSHDRRSLGLDSVDIEVAESDE